MPALERTLAIRNAFVRRDSGLVVPRGHQRLIFDELPGLVLNKLGEVIGVSVMVRLFDGPNEVRIDPHRVICNPPLVPRANLTYEEGTVDTDDRYVGTGRIVRQKAATEGLVYRRIVGAQNPEAALIEAIWDSIDLTPHAAGWRTRGTVTTVYATAPGGNGYVDSSNATYATARTGGTLSALDRNRVGQTYISAVYYCNEAFLIFDTAGIPDTDVVSAVILSLDGYSNNSTTDFIAGAAASTYDGGAVVSGDWVSGASIPTPELATWNSSGYSTGYNAFTETASFKTAINKTGNTSLILYSQRHRDAIAPADPERVTFEDADASGTTTDPKLDITHGGGGIPRSLNSYRQRRL